MMLSEFVERTGFEPMPAEYAKIEEPLSLAMARRKSTRPGPPKLTG